MVRSGTVSISVRVDGNQMIPQGILNQGSFFGEYCLLHGTPNPCDIKAETLAELEYLTKDDFLATMDRFPTFALAVSKVADARVQTATNMVKMGRRANTGGPSQGQNGEAGASTSARRGAFFRVEGSRAVLGNVRVAPATAPIGKVAVEDTFFETMSVTAAGQLARLTSIEQLEVKAAVGGGENTTQSTETASMTTTATLTAKTTTAAAATTT